jgi:hypothetical protein
MTKEEFEQLKPGDIILYDPDFIPNRSIDELEFDEDICIEQDLCGGYFTFKCIWSGDENCIEVVETKLFYLNYRDLKILR